MNKIFIALLMFGAGAIGYYVLQGRDEMLPEDLVEGDVSLEEVTQALQDESDGKVKGSCNDIAESSTCVEYRGSMWADYDSAELNCRGVGVFSKDGCPYSEFGGCRTGAGSVMETVMWMYREGGGGFDDESIRYARAACVANPLGSWVMPEDFLN